MTSGHGLEAKRRSPRVRRPNPVSHRYRNREPLCRQRTRALTGNRILTTIARAQCQAAPRSRCHRAIQRAQIPSRGMRVSGDGCEVREPRKSFDGNYGTALS